MASGNLPASSADFKPNSAHDRMRAARRDFLVAYAAWLAEAPRITDVADETAATLAALTKAASQSWGEDP